MKDLEKKIHDLLDYCLVSFDDKRVTKSVILHKILRDFEEYQNYSENRFMNTIIDH